MKIPDEEKGFSLKMCDSGKKRLKMEINILKNCIEEKELFHAVFKSVIELLAENNDIDKAAEIIKDSLGLHTCYINYDIDTKTDKANIAGLSSNFGSWFSILTRKNQGIPFNFTQDGVEIPLNAASFLRELVEPIVVPPQSYCHLFLAPDLQMHNIDVKTIHEFLTADLGDLLIIPLRKDGGVMILIKKAGDSFYGSEINFLCTLSKSVTLTLNRMYHTFHDELGMKNIVFFRQQLEHVWKDGIGFAIVFIKIKGLRQINEDYSHMIGDKLLSRIIRRLRRQIERLKYKNPDSLVARKSGVIFMVCLPGVSDSASLDRQMSSINRYLTVPYKFEGKLKLVLENTIQFGGCLSTDATSVEELLDHAHDALQEARQNTRVKKVVFDKNLEKRKRWRKKIISVLKSIENTDDNKPGNLRLVYQEKIDARNLKIVGYEALLRLQAGNLPLVKPEQIIKIAEEENLIGNIDLWVVKEACKQIKKWADAGSELPVSVNISRYHLSNRSLSNEIADIFTMLDFADYKHLLKIEITETGLLNQRSIEGLIKLNQLLGLKVSIDDVGKNQANLHAILALYVNNLLESVKIDREYVRKILRYDENRKVMFNERNDTVLDDLGCKYILSMLNMFKGLFNTPGISKPSIICEGVEHKKQEEWLLDNHCYYLQGFLYGKPQLAEQCEERLRRNLSFS
jgi:diguanylate cyclase (GGDEF)-like protein